jgi:phosphatidylserine/phosphatidylglycerophosphate/cardiolipin synthase-like enzyme
MPVARLAQCRLRLCDHEYDIVCKVKRGWGLLTAWLLLWSSACGRAAVAADTLPSPGAASRSGQVAIGSNHVELLTDGAIALRRLRTALSRATATIEAEIYEFNREDVASAMVAALARGVKVTVIEDPTVSVNAATAARLRQAGADVRIFPDQPRQIDHVKLLIVDGATAIFGGMNWGTTSWRNHDFDLALQGPDIAHLEAIFAADLVRCGGRSAITTPPPDPDGLHLLTTYPEAQVRPVVLDAIEQARTAIFIEMFVMTDSQAIAALSDAAHRGVRVFVLFDPNQDLNQLAATAMRQAGVHARFYRTSGEKLHAKAMEVDGRMLVVGSANWTSSGFLHNHELDAVVGSPFLAAQALVRMEADWRASEPV